MAHRKAGGSTKNLQDSNPKYLGVKSADGQNVSVGEIIVRQRGTRYMPGNGVGLGKDHTIYARKTGNVKFSQRRHTSFQGKAKKKNVVSVN